MQLYQRPRFGLRIVLFEVSDESGVSEVLQARGIVGHHVGVSWDEEGSVPISVLALVIAGQSASVGRGLVAGHGPFVRS